MQQSNGPQTATSTGAQLSPRWDDSDMKCSYANVTNVSSTRDEVVLNFGLNQSWERGQAEVTVQLSNRIILSPFAAKRLMTLLDNLMREYESRFGEMSFEGRRQPELASLNRNRGAEPGDPSAS